MTHDIAVTARHANGTGHPMTGMSGRGAGTGQTVHHAVAMTRHVTPHMAGMGAQPPIDAHTLLTAWATTPFPFGVAAVCILVMGWYLIGVRSLARRGRRWPVNRTICFGLGLLMVELALGSSVATMAAFTFTAHITQHLLLMVVAPPLLALGAPMTLLLQCSSRRAKTWLLHGLHSRLFDAISHPITVFFLYYLSMYAFFLSPALQYAMDHMWLMDLINLGFLGGATLFWWPMVGLDPIVRHMLSPSLKLINLLIGVPVESFLGIALLMDSTTVANMYTLGTTHAGGGLLWAGSEFATAIALVPMLVQWSRADERAARRIDARADAGQDITPPPIVNEHGMAATLKAMRR